jgi:hypothetical protein
MSEQHQDIAMQVPADIAVAAMRNEISRLNDDRMSLTIQNDYLRQVVAALQAQINGQFAELSEDTDDSAAEVNAEPDHEG